MELNLIDEAVKEIPNPFQHRVNFTKLGKIKLWLMTFTVFPIRFLVMCILLLIAWFLTSLATMGLSDEETQERPMSGWRKVIKICEQKLGHVFFFVAGFQNIKMIGRKAHASEAPIICVAPHSSFFDTLIEFAGGVYCPVVREQSKSTIILSTLINCTQPVYVKRDDPLSRQHTIQEIRRRALSNDDWEQILIFPEGTCTDRSCLICFKTGAFLPGVPVQPVCVRYPNKTDTVTWTWDGPSAFQVVWLTLTQFHQACEIEFLPVYTPSEAEKQDPRLYAYNVRKLMAKKLGISTCDLSYDDMKYQVWAKERNLLHTDPLVKLLKFRRKQNLEGNEIKEELKKYINNLDKYSTLLDYKEFAEFLEVPVTEVLRDFFDVIDQNRTGFIDPKCYISGLWLLRQDVSDSEKLENSLKVLCDKDRVKYSEFQNVLWLTKGIPHWKSRELFDKLCKDDEYFDFDKLLTLLSYQKLKFQELERKELHHTNANGVVHQNGDVSSSVYKEENNCNDAKKKL